MRIKLRGHPNIEPQIPLEVPPWETDLFFRLLFSVAQKNIIPIFKYLAFYPIGQPSPRVEKKIATKKKLGIGFGVPINFSRRNFAPPIG